MDESRADSVWVQVVELDEGREIGWGSNLARQLGDRAEDLRAAIRAGSATIAESLASVQSPGGWQLTEVSASFGVTLTAEAGVILSRASGAATFDVTVRFERLGSASSP